MTITGLSESRQTKFKGWQPQDYGDCPKSTTLQTADSPAPALVNIVLTDWMMAKESLDTNREDKEDEWKKVERIGGPQKNNGMTGPEERPLRKDVWGVEPRSNHRTTPFRHQEAKENIGQLHPRKDVAYQGK
ncbi:hypothetical protein NDU88_009031 [Pleurodeles waltl]|uniref:Uncharacterized protein n=1 Tax=Pleurodeles waltl TaxID=8319 RepID=A0AAV7RX69_PLEWA|nr:hypothetical protein NDU88_009031 [Pleurodeles waltl]